MTRASQRGIINEIDATDGGAKYPGIAVAIGVDGGPALCGAVLEVIDDAFTTAAASFNGDIVHVQDELVGAVEVTDGYITLAAVGTQVNGKLIPGVRRAVAATGIVVTNNTRDALCRHRPFLDGGEGRSVSGARGGDGHAEMLSSIIRILCLGPEGDGAAQGHLRRHEEVVRRQSCLRIIVVTRRIEVVR